MAGFGGRCCGFKNGYPFAPASVHRFAKRHLVENPAVGTYAARLPAPVHAPHMGIDKPVRVFGGKMRHGHFLSSQTETPVFFTLPSKVCENFRNADYPAEIHRTDFPAGRPRGITRFVAGAPAKKRAPATPPCRKACAHFQFPAAEIETPPRYNARERAFGNLRAHCRNHPLHAAEFFTLSLRASITGSPFSRRAFSGRHRCNSILRTKPCSQSRFSGLGAQALENSRGNASSPPPSPETMFERRDWKRKKREMPGNNGKLRKIRGFAYSEKIKAGRAWRPD